MKKITILDGGMGRELKRMGAPFSQPLWSAQALIESPAQVEKAHQNFIGSNAEIITANSYACVPFHLGEELFQKEGAELARKAAAIAKNVAEQSNHPVRVAGVIPPAFGSYRPDLFKPDEADRIFSALYQAQEPYADLWIAETISSLEEYEAIHSVLKNTAKDCYYAFTLKDEVTEEAALRSGESVKEAAKRVCQHGGEGIFFNCSVPEAMAQAIKDAKEVIDHLGKSTEIGVYANNFAPIGSSHQANDVYQETREMTPEEYLVFAKEWYSLGATTIGGCCGIGPEHIKALSDWKMI